MKSKLKVVEIFESIQGEGFNAGKLAIFIRLSNCNKNCWFCDTDWTKGTEMTVEEIKREISQYTAGMIIWTGGEPTLQLTDDILCEFAEYFNAIETNGTNPVPSRIEYITCSPKVGIKRLHESFPDGVNEFRYPLSEDDDAPDIDKLPFAFNYYVSPVFLGEERVRMAISPASIEKCLQTIKNDQRWKMSIQTHKVLRVR